MKVDELLVGLFPGSRRQEVAGLGAAMAEAAHLIDAAHGGVKFAFSCLKEKYAPLLGEDPMLPVVKGPGEPLMAACDVALVASGTASLELAFFNRPMAVAYPLARWKQALFRGLSTTPFICTVNLLAGRQLVAEHFLAGPADVKRLAASLERFIADHAARADMERALGDIQEAYLAPGASERAAAQVLEFCDRNSR